MLNRDELKELLDQATLGPWKNLYDGTIYGNNPDGRVIAADESDWWCAEDIELVALAPTLATEYLRITGELEAMLHRLRHSEAFDQDEERQHAIADITRILEGVPNA